MRTLKAEGLVSLRAGESDHREKKVYLTQKGTLYASEILSPLHTLEQRVFDIMGAERMKQMTDAIALFNLVFEKEMETQAMNTAWNKKFFSYVIPSILAFALRS